MVLENLDPLQPNRFSILQYLDKLTPTKRKGRYHCPICGGNDFTINPKNGLFSCWQRRYGLLLHVTGYPMRDRNR
jgi:hypothetical protein